MISAPQDLFTGLGKLTLENSSGKKSSTKKNAGRNSTSSPLFESMIRPQWDMAVKPFLSISSPDTKPKLSLFAQPGPREDCPVCYLTLPESNGCQYQACCGKVLCLGCIKGVIDEQIKKNRTKKKKGSKSNKLPSCPFCRKPVVASMKENVSRLKRRAYNNPDDYEALSILGYWYSEGQGEIIPQNVTHGIKLLLLAAQLGSADVYASLGDAYNPMLVENGMYPGIERNILTSIDYYERAAIGGDMIARFNLGVLNMKFFFDPRITMKHFQIAASQGHDEALEAVKSGYMTGDVTKDEFEAALRANYDSKTAVKSIQRMNADLRKIEAGEFEMGEQLDDAVRNMGGWCFLSM